MSAFFSNKKICVGDLNAVSGGDVGGEAAQLLLLLLLACSLLSLHLRAYNFRCSRSALQVINFLERFRLGLKHTKIAPKISEFFVEFLRQNFHFYTCFVK